MGQSQTCSSTIYLMSIEEHSFKKFNFQILHLLRPLNLWNTYIHNIYIIDPSARIINLVSHSTLIVCVNFIHKWRHLQFEVDSERQIFLRNFSWQFYFTLSVFCQKSAERKSPKKYFSYFILMFCL